MNQPIRINFVMPPSIKISGGPLAILEYANRFAARGHTVTVTTFPNSWWDGDDPYPWFRLDCKVHYLNDRDLPKPAKDPLLRDRPFGWLATDSRLWAGLIDSMPECDVNIATHWLTTFPVFFSNKGKPVYFMQHYEELFFSMEADTMLQRLCARMSYGLPLYKVANSSWLKKLMLERFGQDVPFCNNGLIIDDFNPRPKLSEKDGVIRVVTYTGSQQWKGFADAVAAMKIVYERYAAKVEWHVFGSLHETLTERNGFASYVFHPNLSFRELAALYATSDIALCPSWYESFPLPPLEAMASGTAAITTEYGTEDYAIHEKNALVVRSRDAKGMAEAVCRLIEDADLRAQLAVEGRKTAEGLNWDVAVEKREKILLDIVNETHGYDILRSAAVGLREESGAVFEEAPSDVPDMTGLYWDRGALCLMHNRSRHHINSSDLAPELLDRGFPYIQPTVLDIERTPMGRPYSVISDLPPGCA